MGLKSRIDTGLAAAMAGHAAPAYEVLSWVDAARRSAHQTLPIVTSRYAGHSIIATGRVPRVVVYLIVDHSSDPDLLGGAGLEALEGTLVADLRGVDDCYPEQAASAVNYDFTFGIPGSTARRRGAVGKTAAQPESSSYVAVMIPCNGVPLP